MAKPTPPAADAGIAELTKRLDAIIGLLTHRVRGEADSAEIIRVLSAAGLSHGDIAGHLGCQTKTVTQTLYRSRKRKG